MEHLTLTGKLITVIFVLIAALSIAFYRDLKNVIDNSSRDNYVLIIGILSSPENFESRDSIRHTWLDVIADLSVKYSFVIGKHLCNVHPLDRVSPFSCEENRLSLPQNVTSETEFSVLSRKNGQKRSAHSRQMNAIGFGFQTLRSITVKKLGIIRSVLSHVDVRVILRSSDTRKVLASVTITRDLIPADESDIVMKSISPILLEQNAETQLMIEFVTNDGTLLPSCEDFQLNQTPGVNYLQLIRLDDRKPWPFSSDSCSYVCMNYTITDVDSLKNDVLGKKDRNEKWRKWMNDISRRLKNESDYYGDLMFVDIVDVYRNLPNKLIQYFKRIVDMEFSYILKADDDSFIDVARVYKQLTEEINNRRASGLSKRKLWWWSNYREFWKVQETGKWRDDDYRSAAYPSFPCGGGYVLSKEIVDYLCGNEIHLRFFQGEDVSIGIWLSALNTIQHRTPIVNISDVEPVIQERIVKRYGGDDIWNEYLNSSRNKLVPDYCEWTCDNERVFDVAYCNRVQLTPAEMYDVHYEYIRQGFV